MVAAAEPPPPVHHVVRRGETLSQIARRYDVPLAALRDANNLNNTVIHPGETLLIPPHGATVTLASIAAPREDIAGQLPEQQAARAAAKPRVHVVKSGDTLWGLARRYGLTVPALASANGLANSAELQRGARLEIPSGGLSRATSDSSRMTYTVRRGDTLSEIAGQFNVSVRELMTWNKMRKPSSLRAGQRLVLYVDSNRLSGG